MLGELFEEIWAAAFAAAAREVVQLGLTVAWDIFDTAAANLAESWLFPKIRDLTESTKRQLSQAIGDWVRSPDDFEKIVADVRRILPANPPRAGTDRARVIAETEVTAIYAESRRVGYLAAGLKRYRWLSSMDEVTCPICRSLAAANDGEGAVGSTESGKFLNPEDGKFYSCPAHVRCRCSVVADTTELEQEIGAYWTAAEENVPQ